MQMQISGKTALVTGATGGLGMTIAKELALRGATVIVSSRKAAELEELVASLPGEGHSAVVAELGDEGAGERLVAAAEADRPVDIFVANAGLPGSGRFENLSAEDITRVLHVNLEAPIRASRALLPGMLERGSGHLVYVSSLAGKVPSPRAAMYNASKFGLRGFALALRQDLRGSGVGASLVLPGFVRDAGMFADAEMQAPPGIGTSSPEQVADAVARAVETNKAEFVVATPQARAISAIGSSFPVAAAVFQRGRGERVAEELASKQTEKR
jgi:short-subunit dehydrogenase